MTHMKHLAISIAICSLLIGTPGCRTAPGAPVKDLAVAGSTFAEPLSMSSSLDAWYQKTQVKAVYGALSSTGRPARPAGTGQSTSARLMSS